MQSTSADWVLGHRWSRRANDPSPSRRRSTSTARRAPAVLRWRSIFESLWTNYTLFERAGPRLALRGVRALSLDDTVVAEAAEYLGLPS
jgi:hypothetical protein